MQEPKQAIHLSETKDDEQFVVFYGVADKANKLLHETILEIAPLGKPGRRNVYLHWWTLYLGTLADELADASAQLLFLDMPRAAIVTIRQVFEYSVRTQYLWAHEDHAEALMDSLQWRVKKEAELTPGYFNAELREQFSKNYQKWADEHPELDSETKEEKTFTKWAQEVLGNRFDTEWFRAYSYPSIIAHGKPHGIQDVLEPIGPAQVKHSWDSRTIDPLSELSKLAATVIEYVYFIRRKYGLNASKVIEVNELHGKVQDQFGYTPKTPEADSKT